MTRCMVVPRDGGSVKLLTAIGRRYRSAAPEGFQREHGTPESSNIASPERRAAQDASSKMAGAAEEAEHAIENPVIPTTKPPRRRELPISPYMNPKYISAKEKHHTPKLPPSKNSTDLQKLLAKNPYALALATPMRSCRATSVVLPRYFLQDFNLLAHPETEEPWWMPRSLARKYTYPPPGEEDIDGPGDGEAENNGTIPREFDIEEAETGDMTIGKPSKTTDSSPESPPSLRSIGRHAYVLARQPVMAEFEGKKGIIQQKQLGAAFSSQLRSHGPFQRFLLNTNIRPDMSAFVLELLRRRVVEGLEYLVSRRAYVRPCASWEDAKKPSRQVGVILWASPVLDGEKAVDVNDESQTPAPPEFATVDVGTVKKRKVPVHNLDMLLGQDHLQKLREKSSIFNGELVIVRHKKLTIDIQLRLWKLQGYMAEHEQFLDKDQSQGMEHARRQGLRRRPARNPSERGGISSGQSTRGRHKA